MITRTEAEIEKDIAATKAALSDAYAETCEALAKAYGGEPSDYLEMVKEEAAKIVARL